MLQQPSSSWVDHTQTNSRIVNSLHHHPPLGGGAGDGVEDLAVADHLLLLQIFLHLS